MKIVSGLIDHPREARGISLRVALRRAHHGPPNENAAEARYRIEDLPQLDWAVALEFRPALRDDVVLARSHLTRGPFEVELDAFEQALLERCDGRASLGELAVAAASAVGTDEAEPIVRALELFAALARLDALLPGVQST